VSFLGVGAGEDPTTATVEAPVLSLVTSGNCGELELLTLTLVTLVVKCLLVSSVFLILISGLDLVVSPGFLFIELSSLLFIESSSALSPLFCTHSPSEFWENPS